MKTTKTFKKHIDASKRSILIIATLALSILNLNATNEKTTHTNNDAVKTTKNDSIQIFNWKATTTKAIYSGSALSLEEAKQMIYLTTNKNILKHKEITSYSILKTEVNNTLTRNYFWEIKTPTGFAKGYSSSEAYANKMMQLVASGDAIVSKIIISQPQQ